MKKVEPLQWFSPQNNEHLRAHCHIGHVHGGYTAYGIRPHSDGRWKVYSGSFSKKILNTVEECKVFLEDIRKHPEYPYVDWDKPASMMYPVHPEDCMDIV